MKVCIVGAGAIGGFLGSKLAAAGASVSALARGATLQALRRHGWRLQTGEGLLQAPLAAAEEQAEALGVQDLLIIAVKGQALADLAPRLAPLIGPETLVLPAMNGVPWWFCQGLPGFEAPLASVDPAGAIARTIPLERVVGCVVHASCTAPEPGLVRHVMGNGLIVGEPAGGASARVQQLAGLLERAGFAVTVSADIRYDIWYKLWGNLTMNPVSAITGATIDRLLDDELVRQFCSAAMGEAAAIGRLIGCEVTQSPDERHAVTRKLGAFKTSMLQDVEASKPLEIDALVGAVRELGQITSTPTPHTDALLGLVRLMARTRGLY